MEPGASHPRLASFLARGLLRSASCPVTLHPPSTIPSASRECGRARPTLGADRDAPGDNKPWNPQGLRWEGCAAAPCEPRPATFLVRQGSAMADPILLAAIPADPDDGARWLALAQWFADNGRDDEATAVRVFWPGMRSNLAAGRSLETTLEVVR